jgi:2-oxoglutarate ferredoxin oxidoreductase subunit alpha
VPKQQEELAWRVGGPQGSGVDTAAGIFARACAIGGLHLFGRREYYSNIMGRHSYYDVRVAHRPLTSHRDTVDLLTTFEEETLARHSVSAVRGGGIIYEADDADVALDNIRFLDQRARNGYAAYLDERELPPTTAGLLEDARQRGVQTFAVPFGEITRALAQELDVAQQIADRTLNTLAVAVSCALLDYDPVYLKKALEKIFPNRPKIVDMNVLAVERAYDYVNDNFDTSDFDFQLTAEETLARRLLVNGTQTTAMGKLAGGMTFQTYYPISPATDESVWLEAHETFPSRNGADGSVIVVQTEDEISAITMAAGGALTGARSATATSGPGFSLMVEGLGWAGINEVPVVITLYQRGSPSTGMPTRTEQGDLLFAIHAGHGESPRIVLASGDIVDAFYDAAQAFSYAERYQMPVIHMLDKALASTTQTLEPFDVEAVRIDRGEVYTPVDGDGGSPEQAGRGPYARFEPTESGVTPRALLGQPGGTHWLTGGEHTVYGRVTEDPVIREQQMEKRARKLELAAREIPRAEKLSVYGAEDAALTIASWGSNKGAIIEAVNLLAAEGIAARLIQVRLLHPFPISEIEELLENSDPLVVVEASFSAQFAQVLRENTGVEADHMIVKYNGRPMSGQELYRALKDIHQGGGGLESAELERRIVLRNPFE